MHDDSNTALAPTRGFAGIFTLLSDVSKDLEALEHALAAPPPAVAAPQPRLRPKAGPVIDALPVQAPAHLFTSSSRPRAAGTKGWAIAALLALSLLVYWLFW